MPRSIGRGVVQAALGLMSAVAAAPAPPHPTPAAAVSPHNYSFGSGMFGQWKQDRFEFPVYALDVTQDWPTLVGGGMLGNLHQVGNDRLIGMAHGDGSLSIRQDEGGPQWLQALDPAVGQHGGALGYLLSATAAGGSGASKSNSRGRSANASDSSDPELLLHTLNTPESPLGGYELGIGYASKTKSNAAAGVRVAHSVVAPFGDGTAMLVSVKVENLGSAARKLAWVEQWGRLGARVRRNGADDTMRGYRHSIERSASKGGGTILLDTVMSPAAGNTTAPAEHDPSPRPVFLASLGRPASRCGVDGAKLYPHGNSSTPDLANGLSATCGGAGAVEQSTITALEVPFTVGPHAETELFFAVGYLLPGETVARVLEALLSSTGDSNPDAAADADASTQQHPGTEVEAVARVWNASSAAWAATGFVFDVPAVGAWPARETAWHSYLLRASLTFDSFFGAHVLNQNGNYQYQWGQNIALRDPLNHVMPLLYTAPKFVREQIAMAVATSSKDGQLPYGVGNYGQLIPNDASDIGLYALNAAARYVLATGHAGFLREVIPTPWGSLEVGDALWKLARWYMTGADAGGCGVGPHGLIRMHGGDYNDGIRSGCQMGNGKADESGLNAAMAVGIFRSWADVLEAVSMVVVGSSGQGRGRGQSNGGGLAANISQLRAFASQQERAVSATWDENENGGWFARAWSNGTGWCGTVANGSVWWSNAYAILADIPPLNTVATSSANSTSDTGGGGGGTAAARDKLVKSLSEALFTDAGVVFTNSSVHGSYTDAWWAGAMYQYEALGLRGHQDLALATWQRHSLALHSEQFPADLSGIWSSADLWSKRGTGGCGGWEGGYCLHNTWAHTASLWGIPALAGAEFTQQGLLVRPQLDQPRYTIRSPLFGAVKATDTEYAGWWMPMNGSSIAADGAGWQRSMTLIFAAQTRAAFASGGSILTVNGRAVAGAWSEARVAVPLPASGGLCWCVQSNPNDAWCGTVLPAHCV